MAVGLHSLSRGHEVSTFSFLLLYPSPRRSRGGVLRAPAREADAGGGAGGDGTDPGPLSGRRRHPARGPCGQPRGGGVTGGSDRGDHRFQPGPAPAPLSSARRREERPVGNDGKHLFRGALEIGDENGLPEVPGLFSRRAAPVDQIAELDLRLEGLAGGAQAAGQGRQQALGSAKNGVLEKEKDEDSDSSIHPRS